MIAMKYLFFYLFILCGCNSAIGDSGADSDLFVGIVDQVIPAIANISSVSTVERPLLIPFPFDELFYGKPKPMIKISSLGSALLIDSSGLMITNYHVVGEMSDVKIVFTDSPDEKPVQGKVIGKDQELDIALISIDLKKKITPVVFGNSDTVRVGEFVLAVGNPFGQGHSVSHGILSAKGRALPGGPFGGFLQTDAPINPGNSGGPLLNMKGEVIGINTAIQFNAQGISFAIPINSIKEILPQLKEKGRVDRAYLGVVIENLSPGVAAHLKANQESRAAVITTVYDNSPAHKSGLKPYDVVISINNVPIYGSNQMMATLYSSKIGEQLDFSILREGKEKKIKVILDKKTSEEKLAMQKQEKEMILVDPKSGVRIEKFPDGKGFLVTGVITGGPAERSGIMLGDVLVEIDQKPIRSLEQYRSFMIQSPKHLIRLMRTRMGKETFTIIELDLT